MNTPLPADRLRDIYQSALTKEVRKYPKQYSYGVEDVPKVVNKMLLGLSRGTANIKGSLVLRQIAKTLQIENTVEAWKVYLKGYQPPKPVPKLDGEYIAKVYTIILPLIAQSTASRQDTFSLEGVIVNDKLELAVKLLVDIIKKKFPTFGMRIDPAKKTLTIPRVIGMSTVSLRDFLSKGLGKELQQAKQAGKQDQAQYDEASIKESLTEGPYVDGRILPRLSDGEIPRFLYRIMSSAEYEAAEKNLSFKTLPGQRTHASVNPLFEYCEPSKNNVLVKFKYRDADGWKAKLTGIGVVAITSDPITFTRATLIAVGDRKHLEHVYKYNNRDTAKIVSINTDKYTESLHTRTDMLDIASDEFDRSLNRLQKMIERSLSGGAKIFNVRNMDASLTRAAKVIVGVMDIRFKGFNIKIDKRAGTVSLTHGKGMTKRSYDAWMKSEGEAEEKAAEKPAPKPKAAPKNVKPVKTPALDPLVESINPKNFGGHPIKEGFKLRAEKHGITLLVKKAGTGSYVMFTRKYDGKTIFEGLQAYEGKLTDLYKAFDKAVTVKDGKIIDDFDPKNVDAKGLAAAMAVRDKLRALLGKSTNPSQASRPSDFTPVKTPVNIPPAELEKNKAEHKSDDELGYTISKARYAKGMMAVVCKPAVGNMKGLKTRAMRLASSFANTRYSGRENAYIMSPAAAKKFAQTFKDGWDASAITGERTPPEADDSEPSVKTPVNTPIIGEVDPIIWKEWKAMTFSWRLLRSRRNSWFYLERDGKLIAEGKEPKELLSMGWYSGNEGAPSANTPKLSKNVKIESAGGITVMIEPKQRAGLDERVFREVNGGYTWAHLRDWRENGNRARFYTYMDTLPDTMLEGGSSVNPK
jgi:hypothetical protein